MNPKYYKLKVEVNNYFKTIEIISNDENFNTKRVEREIFGEMSVKPYKIIKFEIIKQKLGI